MVRELRGRVEDSLVLSVDRKEARVDRKVPDRTADDLPERVVQGHEPVRVERVHQDDAAVEVLRVLRLDLLVQAVLGGIPLDDGGVGGGVPEGVLDLLPWDAQALEG